MEYRFDAYEERLTPAENVTYALIEIARALHRLADRDTGAGALERIGEILDSGLSVDCQPDDGE